MLARGEATDGTEQAKGSEVEKKINAVAMKKLLKDYRSADSDIDQLRLRRDGVVDKVIEKFNVNTKMLGWIKQLDKMTPEKLADNIDDFLHMFDVSGLRERAESAQRLPMEAEAGEG